MTLTQSAHRVPPHSLEAEESVLGAMLLAPETSVSDVLDKLRSDDFYKPAHRKIFDAVVALFGRGEAVDSVTVSEELRRAGILEEVGGKGYLFQLVNSVPAASNAAYYARIVEETSLLRRLIEATQEAAALAFESSEDVDNIVDQVEATIFAVAEKRLGDRFSHIRDLLHDQLEHIEALSLKGAAITGVPSGFIDLDNLTSGLQNSNLIIVAARPSFGKTSFALNIAQQAATEHEVPVAIFSLEMSKTELVQRLVCAEALVDVHKLRTGNLNDQDWSRLATAVGRLADAPIYIDDSEAVTVLEIRAKARRLKQKSGLGLVVVDYIQLMSGPRRSENRQQEISEVSRSLKILARELNVPVIALSQLSRAVESRQDKRPMLADLRECVTGDTLVSLADGRRVPIASLVGTTPRVLSMTPDGKIVEAVSDKVWKVGTRPVFKVTLASGRTIRATGRHRLYAASGWERVETLRPGDRVALARSLPEPASTERWPDLRVALLGQLIGDGSYLSGQPMRYATQSEENSAIVARAASEEFGCEVKRYRGRRSWHQLLISGNGTRWKPKGVNAWLRELGVFGQRSHEKRIPEAAFRLPNDQIALLLQHLWATDGSIWTRDKGGGSDNVYFATNSVGLADDVAGLLVRLGIVARVYTAKKGGYRPYYHVAVSGSRDQRRFLEVVGAFGPRCEQASRLRQALDGRRTSTNVDTVPIEFFDQVKTVMKSQGVTTSALSILRGVSTNGSAAYAFAPSREHFAEYAELLDNDGLREIAYCDIFWDRIRSIEPDGREEVFDLTVPGPSSWLAGVVISHNSGALEQDADVVMFIYRDEIYNHDSQDKGTAEILVAKHRNGPVGRLKLTFLENYTKFANYMGS